MFYLTIMCGVTPKRSEVKKVVSCSKPLRGFKVGLTESGKDKYKIVPWNVKALGRRGDVWHYLTEKDLEVLNRFDYDHFYSESIEIPCGQCDGCHLDYARQWADRCLLESLYHDCNYFVTLTYSSPPVSHYVDESTGEYLTSATLFKKDVQDFMKRLRKDGKEFRYFCCGEYGGKTMRPHYHVLFFGLELGDLHLHKLVGQNAYYISPYLEKKWSHGFCLVTSLSYSACAYTCRYVVKKSKRSRKAFDKFNMQPEFTIMSRKPGLGSQFFVDHNMYDFDYIPIPGTDRPIKIRPGRFYDSRLEKFDPDRYAEVKAKRLEIAKMTRDSKLTQTDYDVLEMLDVEGQSRAQKINKLRSGIDEA